MASEANYSLTLTDCAGSGVETTESSEEIGFVVVWCPETPQILGSWLPIGSADDPKLLGRGPAQASDAYPRLSAVRQRPGVNEQLGPFFLPKLSRVQLEVCAASSADVRVKNVGKARLLVNGAEVSSANVRPSDVLEIGSSLALMCTRRPPRLPALAALDLQPFGAPDAYGVVGESPGVWALRREINFISSHEGHVLVCGPSGSGKELVASAIARSSDRARAPFISRNAATLPEGLVDAELFGNVKNYPNPGMADRPGLIGAADGGVLFLDEFAELAVSTQTHLLRVLDAGEYQRLGEATARRANFRLIAATNRPLSVLRDDVAARFAFRVDVPSLVSRKDDIPLIVQHLLRKIFAEHKKLGDRFSNEQREPNISAQFIRNLLASPLETNVREIVNLLWRSLTKSANDELEWHALETQQSDAPSVQSQASEPQGTERERIQQTLDANNGSIEKAWRALGLSSRHALTRLLRKHKIEIKRKHEG